MGGGSLMEGDRVVGTITSGDWGYRTGLNLAYAFVEPHLADLGCVMKLDLCGDFVDAQVINASPYDSEHLRMRA